MLLQITSYSDKMFSWQICDGSLQEPKWIFWIDPFSQNGLRRQSAYAFTPQWQKKMGLTHFTPAVFCKKKRPQLFSPIGVFATSIQDALYVSFPLQSSRPSLRGFYIPMAVPT